MKSLIEKLFKRQAKRVSPEDREQRQFEEQARQQFVQLKKKGLSIPVISL